MRLAVDAVLGRPIYLGPLDPDSGRLIGHAGDLRRAVSGQRDSFAGRALDFAIAVAAADGEVISSSVLGAFPCVGQSRGRRKTFPGSSLGAIENSVFFSAIRVLPVHLDALDPVADLGKLRGFHHDLKGLAGFDPGMPFGCCRNGNFTDLLTGRYALAVHRRDGRIGGFPCDRSIGPVRTCGRIHLGRTVQGDKALVAGNGQALQDRHDLDGHCLFQRRSPCRIVAADLGRSLGYALDIAVLIDSGDPGIGAGPYDGLIVSIGRSDFRLDPECIADLNGFAGLVQFHGCQRDQLDKRNGRRGIERQGRIELSVLCAYKIFFQRRLGLQIDGSLDGLQGRAVTENVGTACQAVHAAAAHIHLFEGFTALEQGVHGNQASGIQAVQVHGCKRCTVLEHAGYILQGPAAGGTEVDAGQGTAAVEHVVHVVDTAQIQTAQVH